jgi:mRNA interferase MazF
MSDVQRGEIWWADLPEPRGSETGFPRPVLVVQADAFNQSRIRTVIIAAITSNLALSSAPGNVPLPRNVSGLREESVINVSQLAAIDRGFLTDYIGKIPPRMQTSVDAGLRLVLAL